MRRAGMITSDERNNRHTHRVVLSSVSATLFSHQLSVAHHFFIFFLFNASTLLHLLYSSVCLFHSGPLSDVTKFLRFTSGSSG